MSNFSLNVGDLTEDAVQSSVERAFSADFVFRSPRMEDDKEVTDILVLFGDVAIVLQAKSQAMRPGRAPDPSLQWAAKNLKKAGRQVSGAIRALRNGRATHIKNSRRGRVEFDPERFRYVHGLVVVHHASDPYDPLIVAPSLRAIEAPLHVISYRDFWNLSRLVDTPSDLIVYLDSRADVLIPTLNPRVHEEERAFSFYVDRHVEVAAAQARLHQNEAATLTADLYAQGLRWLMHADHAERVPGQVIDHVIDRVHEIDPSMEPIPAGGRDSQPVDQEASNAVATHLGKIPRVRRVALGRRYLEIAKKAADAGRSTHFLTVSKGRSDCLLFLASPEPQEKRDDRRKELYALTALAKAYCEVDTAMGVVTEEAGRMGSSYDFVLISGEPNSSEELKQLGRSVFGEFSGNLAKEILPSE